MKANYEIVASESTPRSLVIRDLGPWHKHATVTNAAESVVEELYKSGQLTDLRSLFYYDSEDKLDEIDHAHGKFLGFRPLAGI